MIKMKNAKMKKTFASASKKIKTKKNASKLAEKMQNFIKRKISEQGKINKENENPNEQINVITITSNLFLITFIPSINLLFLILFL